MRTARDSPARRRNQSPFEIAFGQLEEQLLVDFRRVRGKTGVLFRLAEAAIDHPDNSVK